MPAGLSTTCEFYTGMQKFKARPSRSHNFEIMVMSFCHEQRREKKKKQTKIDCFNMDGFCDHFKTVMVLYYHFCSCQKTECSLAYQDTDWRKKNQEMVGFGSEYKPENFLLYCMFGATICFVFRSVEKWGGILCSGVFQGTFVFSKQNQVQKHA